jgi:hypothetical protein
VNFCNQLFKLEPSTWFFIDNCSLSFFLKRHVKVKVGAEQEIKKRYRKTIIIATVECRFLFIPSPFVLPETLSLESFYWKPLYSYIFIARWAQIFLRNQVYHFFTNRRRNFSWEKGKPFYLCQNTFKNTCLKFYPFINDFLYSIVLNRLYLCTIWD